MNEFNLYNHNIKKRFLTENEFSQYQKDQYRVLFTKTKVQEDSLKKDIYQMNKEESELLLHFLKPRSTQHASFFISILRFYIHWCDNQGLIPHHINYFEGLGGNVSKQFIWNQAINNQIIDKETLVNYTNELTSVNDYQGALIINLLYLGVNLDQNDDKCELRNIKVLDIDFDNQKINTSKRIIIFNDILSSLIPNALEQEEMIIFDEKSENIRNKKAWTFNNFNYLVRGRKNKSLVDNPTSYSTIVKKLREVGTFVNNPHINPTYLNLSGIIDYIKSNYNDLDKQKIKDQLKIYEDLIEVFKLDTTKIQLRYRLLPFLD